MLIQFVDEYIERKLEEDEKCIICSFFELRVIHNRKEEELNEILYLLETRLTNMRYKLYHKGEYYNRTDKVKDNQFFVAVKEQI